MALPTLAQVAMFNRDVFTGVIDQAVLATPEVSTIGWRTVNGTTYQTLKRTVAPTVAFRAVNAGVAIVPGTYANTTITMKLLNPRWICDKALADANIWGPEAYIAAEAQSYLNQTMVVLGKQLWYGTGNDAGGFTGLQSAVDSGCVVDATGTTASTGSSVMITAGVDNLDNLCWSIGNNGNLAIGDVRIGDASDGTNTFTAYIQEAQFWVGAQLGHAKALARIKNLTADSGKGLTDDLIYRTLEKLPSALKPSGIYMTRRSQRQLRASRTATNATGAPAPLPTEVEGIPIYITECLLDTETIA